MHHVLTATGSTDPVIDADWDEMLIDVGTEEKRAAVLAVMKPWIEGCKNDGYDAVELDNLDSFSRSNELLDENDAVLMMQAFAQVAARAVFPGELCLQCAVQHVVHQRTLARARYARDHRQRA